MQLCIYKLCVVNNYILRLLSFFRYFMFGILRLSFFRSNIFFFMESCHLNCPQLAFLSRHSPVASQVTTRIYRSVIPTGRRAFTNHIGIVGDGCADELLSAVGTGQGRLLCPVIYVMHCLCAYLWTSDRQLPHLATRSPY